MPVSRADGVRWLSAPRLRATLKPSGCSPRCMSTASAPADPRALAGETASTNLFSAKQALEPDFVAAEKWARRAAEHGSADGQAVLAYILTSGPESMRNLEEAHEWYQRAAEAGCPQGALGYAQSLARSVKDEEGRRRLPNIFVVLHRPDWHRRSHLLGVLTERGCGTERDPAAAAAALPAGGRQGQPLRPGELGTRADGGARSRAKSGRRRVLATPGGAGRRSGCGGAGRRPVRQGQGRCRPIMRRRRSGFAVRQRPATDGGASAGSALSDRRRSGARPERGGELASDRR